MKISHGCLSVCLSVCPIADHEITPADSSPFDHLSTKLRSKTCSQQAIFCPSCPNCYLFNPCSVRRMTKASAPIYMSESRVPELGGGLFVWTRHQTYVGSRKRHVRHHPEPDKGVAGRNTPRARARRKQDVPYATTTTAVSYRRRK